MLGTYLVLDVATAPIADAAAYLDGQIDAPSNYKDPQKIADYIATVRAERAEKAAVDMDLARITGIAVRGAFGSCVLLAQNELQEREHLEWLALTIDRAPVITYGGFHFDLPVLMRRALYLGVDFPELSTDRYRSDHLDLCEILSDRDPKRRRPLGFYVKRLGWTDLSKPLDGAAEAKVLETGQWAELAASMTHDVEATYRLAVWRKLVTPFAAVLEPEPVV